MAFLRRALALGALAAAGAFGSGCNNCSFYAGSYHGCGTADGGVAPDDAGPRVLMSVTIEPGRITLPPSTDLPLVAVGHYTDGTTSDLSAGVVWTATPVTVATVQTGMLHTVAEGMVTVSCSASGMSGATTFTVSQSVLLAQLTITPPALSVFTDATSQLRADGRFSDGTHADLTSAVSWSSVSPGVARVASGGGTAGLVTGVTAGTTAVSASFLGTTAAMPSTVTVAQGSTLTSIVVSPGTANFVVGGGAQLTATGYYSDSTMRDLSAMVAWTADSAVVTVANGYVTGQTVGTTTVRATYNAKVGMAVVTVGSNVTLSSISVTPGTQSTTVGTSVPYTAIARYSDSTTNNVSASATWSSSNSTVATMNGSQAYAQSGGTTIISATYMGVVSNQASLSVQQPVTLTSVTVSPSSISCSVSQSSSVGAMAYYSDGSSLDVTYSASWYSDASNAASVSSGQVYCQAAGGADIYAVYQGVSSNYVYVTVSSPSLSSIAMTCPSINQSRSTTQYCSAMGYYSDGSQADLTYNASWQCAGRVTCSSYAVTATTLTGAGQVRAGFYDSTVGQIYSNIVSITVY